MVERINSDTDDIVATIVTLEVMQLVGADDGLRWSLLPAVRSAQSPVTQLLAVDEHNLDAWQEDLADIEEVCDGRYNGTASPDLLPHHTFQNLTNIMDCQITIL